MISAITLSNLGKNILYLHTRDITKEDQEQIEWTTKDSTGVSLPRSTTWPGI
jgi:hypothetical protein